MKALLRRDAQELGAEGSPVNPPPIRLDRASLEAFGRVLLEETTWQVERDRVTVMIGPAGTGKSALLRALGARAPLEFKLGGTWCFAGAHSTATTRERVALVPQLPTGGRRTLADIVDLVDPTRHDIILLDEPDHGLSQDDLSGLARRIDSWKRGRAVLVITHNLEFARRIGDDAVLLCAGRFWATGSVAEVFASPPNALTRRFLEQGNCWPGPEPPHLPAHFAWLLPDRLAGMGKPGLMRDPEHDIEAIAHAGITQLVSLTMQPFPVTTLSPFGIEGRHFPIQDMGIPAVGSTIGLCSSIDRTLKHGGRVAVHCHAGLGRTGTVLAAYLIYKGSDAESAIARVRAQNPKYIQSAAQSDFLRRFTG